jgi:peptidoglycan/LPS O-acetylase OafA/YrhL
MPRIASIPKDAPPTTLPGRFTELDSLRGIAALTVVFHHFRQMWENDRPLTGWWKVADRLVGRPLSAGDQAVYLFFVLSGFVLSVPYLRGKGQDYLTFIGRRTLRLYAPYLFALALAVAGAAIWHGPHGHSQWADLHWSTPVSGRLLLLHILFLGNYNYAEFNAVFWTLVLEMRVSLIFPPLFAMVFWLRPQTSIILAACLLSVGTFYLHNDYWENLASALIAVGLFVAGILLAKEMDSVRSRYLKLGAIGGLIFAAVSLYCFEDGDRVTQLLPAKLGVQTMLTAAGATGLIVLAIASPRVRHLLNLRIPRFLGRISYSLYLIHCTVLFALTSLLPSRLSEAAQFPIFLAASLLIATVFCLLIEEPFLRLSRRVGRWRSQRLQEASV